MNTDHPSRIAVIGAGQADEELRLLAETVGRAIAEAGLWLVCGGLGGVMAAASAGARRAGGTTIGILPGTDRGAANPHISIPIVTGLGEGRNLLVVRNADVVIAVGGEWGTLSEIALARKLGKPVIGLRTWNLQYADGTTADILSVDTPTEAIEAALELLARR